MKTDITFDLPLKNRIENVIHQTHCKQKSFALDMIEKTERQLVTRTDAFYGRALALNAMFWSGVEQAEKFLERSNNDLFAPVGTADH